MELPFGTEGRKATHDFLSLYSPSTAHVVQQDPAPPQGGYLKTHDFLRPLERVGKNGTTKEENRGGMAAVERPPPVPGHPAASVEHLLPGGIGTYSICYINQRAALKPERSLFTTTQTSGAAAKINENSNCSSYPASGFSLMWHNESAVQTGKTGKENFAAERHALQGVSVVGGQLPPFKKSPSNHNPMNETFSSLSSSQPSTSQRSQSFMDMITSSKNDHDEEDEEEEDDFIIKKESSPPPKGNLSVKVEAKTTDQKPNTPRSKHSATEQRRRSKINDRFLKLREVIPNSDQKRDKASFLLEVIDHIQFLQEKVNRYESSYDTWSNEPSKKMDWRNHHIHEDLINCMQGAKPERVPALVFPMNLDENKPGVSSSIPTNGHNLIDTDTSTAATFKGRSQQPELTSKAASVHPTTLPNIFSLARTSIAASPKQASDTNHQTVTWPPSQQKRSCKTNCTGAEGNRTRDQEPTIESGTINTSSIYSQGLLATLTQALRKSGVDLSQANLSVQIDLGKRANGPPVTSSTSLKDHEVPIDHATKKLRTC